MEKRLGFVFIFFLGIFLLILVKLFYWQVLSSDSLGGLAEKQRLSTIPIKAARGRILASDGSSLVINKKAYGVYLEPKKIDDKDKIISVLSKELELPSSSISANLSNSSLFWIPVAHKVDEEKVEDLKKFNLKGLTFMDEQKRFYPESSMAAHLLGFVGKNAKGEDQGYFGVEGYYDEQLSGRDGVLMQDQDALGNPILSGARQNIPAEDGRDLFLYLDKTIQYIVENKLKEGIEKYGAKGGSVIVMDPSTGGILALAAYPSYDPGIFSKFPSEYYKNPTVASFYEPGSTFKVLVMAAAINEGKVTAGKKFNEDGPVEIGGYTIKTWNQKYHGEITLSQVLEYSSNVGMVFVEKQLDKNVFLRYIKDLGFGNLTGVDLQEESTPQLRPANKWYEIDYATSSFGQGIATTPLQMITAVSAIANGGKLMEPHVVKSIKLADGKMININPKVNKIIYSKETTSVLKEMMVSAVDKGETRFLKPVGFRIAGKTGTAQIPISGHYDTEKTIASFVGFAPVDKPKFLMLVTIREPSSSPWGSETAAPIFFSVAREIFPYLKISAMD